MKITDVEAVILRQPVLDDGIADGSQDDLVVLVHTDEGITGIGEVDSAPEAVRAIDQRARLARDREQPARSARRRGPARRRAPLAQDVPRPDLLRPPRDRAARDQRHRHRALGHQGQGAREAGLRADRHAAARPGARLRLDADARHARRGARAPSRRCASRASPPSSSAGGRSAPTPTTTSRSRPRPRGGRRRRDDPDRRRPRLRQRTRRRRSASPRGLEELGVFWLEEPFEPDEYEAYAELADAVDIRVAAGEQDTTLWGFRELIERGHVDLVQPDVTRCGGITELLRIAEFAHERGVETVPHAWKSGIIKAASLHVNAVLPDALFQEYCVAETPINTLLTRERLPIDSDGIPGRADRPRPRRRARPGRARALPRRLERSGTEDGHNRAEHRRRRAGRSRRARDPGRREQRPAPAFPASRSS